MRTPMVDVAPRKDCSCSFSDTLFFSIFVLLLFLSLIQLTHSLVIYLIRTTIPDSFFHFGPFPYTSTLNGKKIDCNKQISVLINAYVAHMFIELNYISNFDYVIAISLVEGRNRFVSTISTFFQWFFLIFRSQISRRSSRWKFILHSIQMDT